MGGDDDTPANMALSLTRKIGFAAIVGLLALLSIASEAMGQAATESVDLAWAEVMEAYEAQDRVRLSAAAERTLPSLDRALTTASAQDDAWRALQRQRGFVLGVLGRVRESREAFAAVEDDAWLDPSFLSLRFDAAAFAEDGRGMVEVIEALVRLRGDAPDSVVANLSDGIVGSLHRRLIDDPELSERFVEALIAADWNRNAAPGARDWVFARAMRSRFDRGDEIGAIRFLDRIQGPQALVETFLRNRYAGLWPIIEQRAGADLGRLAQSYEATLRDAQAIDPANVAVLELYVLHLNELGRHAEALALAAPVVDDADRVDDAGEKGFWLVNHAAYSELALGRGDAALTRMERLLGRGIEANPMLISMAINRVLMLRSLGRYDQALAGAEALAAQTEGNNIASDYGRMLIWSAAACSAHALDQREAAAQWRARLEATPQTNESAVLRAYLCLDDLAAAEAFVIERLASANPTTMLKALQRSSVDSRPTPTDAELAARFEALRERSAVRAAIARIGRVREFAFSVS